MENPEFDVSHRDITAILKDGMQKKQEITREDGSKEIVMIIDEKSAWWKTHHVASPRFGRLATVLEHFEGLADDCKYNMNFEWAQVLSGQIMAIADHYRKGIDAKSSETMKDARSSQTSLVDKYLRNKQERVYNLQGDAKKSIFQGLFGKEDDGSD